MTAEEHQFPDYYHPGQTLFDTSFADMNWQRNWDTTWYRWLNAIPYDADSTYDVMSGYSRYNWHTVLQ